MEQSGYDAVLRRSVEVSAHEQGRLIASRPRRRPPITILYPHQLSHCIMPLEDNAASFSWTRGRSLDRFEPVRRHSFQSVGR